MTDMIPCEYCEMLLRIEEYEYHVVSEISHIVQSQFLFHK